MSTSKIRIHTLPADVARLIAEQVAEANQERNAAVEELTRLREATRSAAKKLSEIAISAELYNGDIANMLRHSAQALAVLSSPTQKEEL
ncbi:hypothetical protein [Methylobacterium oryzisoli]|uniref:hypothetical protein n=1 Tax=Methylobacterium oryzisoli TaxID=3385502 RepID=UPI0038928E99